MNSQKSFFEKLLDLSFSSFITPQIAGAVYALGLIIASLVALSTALSGFLGSNIFGILFSIVMAAMGLLAFAIVSRISLEGFVAVIRTAENTRILAEEVISRGANGSEQN